MSGGAGTSAAGITPTGGTFVQAYLAQDIVNLAARSSGILGEGQTLSTQTLSDLFSMLQGMLAIWQRKRWLIWHLLDLPKLCTLGKQSYTIGAGGDYDYPRPDRIEGAYIRQIVTGGPNNAQNVDYWLVLLEAMEDYAKLALKSLTSWPEAIFYDAAFPIGNLFPYPIPQSPSPQLELHVLVKDTLQRIPSLTTPINLPEEYFEAIWTNLTLRIGALYPGANVTPFTVGLARASLATIRSANAQVPRLLMPQWLIRPPLFNIYSYQTY